MEKVNFIGLEKSDKHTPLRRTEIDPLGKV